METLRRPLSSPPAWSICLRRMASRLLFSQLGSYSESPLQIGLPNSCSDSLVGTTVRLLVIATPVGRVKTATDTETYCSSGDVGGVEQRFSIRNICRWVLKTELTTTATLKLCNLE